MIKRTLTEPLCCFSHGQDDRAAVLRPVFDRLKRSQLRRVHDEAGKGHGAQQSVRERRKRGLMEGKSQFADHRERRSEHDAFLRGHRVQSGHRVGKTWSSAPE